MVPTYLHAECADIVQTHPNARNAYMQPEMMTAIERPQNKMSAHRHDLLLKHLITTLHVSFPSNHPSTAPQRDMRHAHVQLAHLQASSAAVGMTVTAAMLNTLPLYRNLEYDNRTMRAFLRSMLRLHPATTSYSSACPLCSLPMHNLETHSHICNKHTGLKTLAHDKVVKAVYDELARRVCDSPRLEPPGRSPDSNKRPDIEFRNSDATTTAGFTVADCDSYHTTDISIVGLVRHRLIDVSNPTPPPTCFGRTDGASSTTSTPTPTTLASLADASPSSSPSLAPSTHGPLLGSNGARITPATPTHVPPSTSLLLYPLSSLLCGNIIV